VDYGELPHIIFHSDMFKSVLAVILNTTDDLHVCVCRGISDPALTDIAERKKQHLSYYFDSCGTIILLMEKLLNVSEVHVPNVLTCYLMN